MKIKLLRGIATILFKILDFVGSHLNQSLPTTKQREGRIIKIGDYISTNGSGYGIVYYFRKNWYCLANDSGLISRAFYFDEIKEHLTPHEYFKGKGLYGYGHFFKAEAIREVETVLNYWKASHWNQCKAVYIDYKRSEVEMIEFPSLYGQNFG